MAKTSKKIGNATDDIIDIDLSAVRRKRFRIDSDNNKILELNVSDLSIVNRLADAYPKLDKLQESLSLIASTESTEENEEEALKEFSAKFKEVDDQMRELVDYIFDSNVSEVCVDHGSMYDPINGQHRYEYIITILMGLYEENLANEMRRIHSRMKQHTAKYTK